jgi:hypothetical protein
LACTARRKLGQFSPVLPVGLCKRRVSVDRGFDGGFPACCRIKEDELMSATIDADQVAVADQQTVTVIKLTDRRPIAVHPNDWDIIASASWRNTSLACQANYVRYIAVRQHADGRRLVYGEYKAGPAGGLPSFRGMYGGYLLEAAQPDRATIEAIRKVAREITHPALGDECIAGLPAEEDRSAPPVAAAPPAEVEPVDLVADLDSALALVYGEHKEGNAGASPEPPVEPMDLTARLDDALAHVVVARRRLREAMCAPEVRAWIFVTLGYLEHSASCLRRALDEAPPPVVPPTED